MARAGSRAGSSRGLAGRQPARATKIPKKKVPLSQAADKPRSVAHNLDSAGTNITHSIRHIKAGGDPANRQHALHHAQETNKDLKGLMKSAAKVPAVRKEFAKLAATKPKPPIRGRKR